MIRHADNRLGSTAVRICRYLNKYDAHTEVLAKHCKCSVVTIRRALKVLRRSGLPLKYYRHHTGGVVDCYWRLTRVVEPGEVLVALSPVYFPRDEVAAVRTRFYNRICT